MLFQVYRNCAVVRLFDIIGTGKRSPFSLALAVVFSAATATMTYTAKAIDGTAYYYYDCGGGVGCILLLL